MAKQREQTVVNIPLPVKIHAAAKAKAALAQKSLQDWLATVIAEAAK